MTAVVFRVKHPFKRSNAIFDKGPIEVLRNGVSVVASLNFGTGATRVQKRVPNPIPFSLFLKLPKDRVKQNPIKIVRQDLRHMPTAAT